MVEISRYTLEAVGVTVSVLMSFVGAILSQAVVSTDQSQISILVGLAALLTGFVVTDYVNSERGFLNIQDELEDIKRASSYFSEIEEHPSYRPRIQNFVSDFTTALNGHEFFQQKADESLRDLERDMQELANGRFTCPADSTMEPQITRNLLRMTDDYIKAISYDGEDWWLDNNGKRYMSRQEDLLRDKDVDIYRIFITPTNRWDEMEEVFEWHEQNDIEWDVISPEEFPTEFLDRVGEFVIYDGELLREGDPTRGVLENDIVITTSTPDIQDKHADFAEIASNTELNIPP